MTSLVSVGLLKPHPKNAEYFSPATPEKRAEIRRSILAQGIRDPLKVAPDYTVIAGHLRLEIAKELGFEKVPVEIVDGDPEYLEYFMVADNEERRVCQDPVKKAKRAAFLARYWGVRQGSLAKPGTPEGKFFPQAKTLADVAEAVGTDERTLKNLLKLNDLIPPLQELVSAGRLGQTAAYSLAFLLPKEQYRLLEALGDSGVCGLSVAQARKLRGALEAERARAEKLAREVAELETLLAESGQDPAEVARLAAELEALRRENEELRSRRPEVVERAVEEVVFRADPALEAQLEASRAEAARLGAELEAAQKRVALLLANEEKERARAENLKKEKETLERRLEAAKEEITRLRKGEVLPAPLEKELGRAAALAADLLLALDAVLKHPDKLKELAGTAKTAGAVAGADSGQELSAATGELAALTLRQAVLALEAVGARIAALLEVFDAKKGGGRRLRLVKGREGRSC